MLEYCERGLFKWKGPFRFRLTGIICSGLTLDVVYLFSWNIATEIRRSIFLKIGSLDI